MTMTDPIADMLTRLRNGNKARSKFVDVPKSKMKLELTRLLKGQGFIEDFKVMEIGPGGMLRLFMKYSDDGGSAIRGLKRVSKPGCRRYVGVREMPRPLRGLGVAVVSTPKGIMTDTQAREAKVGGEVVCYLW
ncbi:MAG: 30S ribosomal protein S8 [Candidatus Aureabacteria bacterium]|nr:30S ribosomal protein S8 [Candidatus Auribacterota bacterium]